MGKTRVLPSLVEQELNLIMLGKQRPLVWKSVFSGQLTKLDSSGLWRERRVIPIFTGIGRFTGGLSRLSYLNNLSYFFAFLVIPEHHILFPPNTWSCARGGPGSLNPSARPQNWKISSKCSKALPSVVAVSGEGADLKRSKKEGHQQSNGHHSEALLCKANGTPIDSRVFVSTGFSSREMFRCERQQHWNRQLDISLSTRNHIREMIFIKLMSYCKFVIQKIH